MAESEVQRSETLELREYFRILWYRKWTIVLVLAAVAGGAIYLSYRTTPIYQSQARVLAPLPAASVGESGQVVYGNANLEDESQVATSEPVAARVIKALKLQDTSPPALVKSVDVAPLKNAESVLLFQATSPIPRRAASLAHEFAVQYMAYRGEQNAAALRAQLETVKGQLTNAIRGLRKTDPIRSPEEASRLSAAKVALSTRRDELSAAIVQVTESGGDILADAQVPTRPVRPSHVRDGVLAVLVGLILGSGAAFVRDYLDDRLRGGEDVERQAGAPLVGAIPHAAVRGDGSRGKKVDRMYLVVVEDARAHASEAYRTLRTNLMFMAATGPLRKTLVTSPSQGEGKSTTAANLAVVMAQAGKRVLLADADLRRPGIHRFFDMHNEVGLSSILSGQASLEEAVQNPGIQGLRLVSGGPVPPNPVELLGSPAMKTFLNQVAEVTDWLILDAPPVLGLADASVLSSISDGVLLVVTESTHRRTVSHARDQLEKVSARIVGTVLNNFGTSFTKHYADYYAYSSDYGQGRADGEESEDKVLRQSRKAARRDSAAEVASVEDAPVMGLPVPSNDLRDAGAAVNARREEKPRRMSRRERRRQREAAIAAAQVPIGESEEPQEDEQQETPSGSVPPDEFFLSS